MPIDIEAPGASETALAQALRALMPWAGARVRKAATLTGQDVTSYVTLGFDSEDVDTHGFHESVTNPSRLTIPAGQGIARIIMRGQLHVENLATGAGWFLLIQGKDGTAPAYTVPGYAAYNNNPNITPYQFPWSTGIWSVGDGTYFDQRIKYADVSLDIHTGTSFEIEVVDWYSCPDVTNLISSPYDFTNAAWTPTENGTPVASTIQTLTDDDAGTYEYVTQSITVTAAREYEFQARILKDSVGKATRVPLFRFRGYADILTFAPYGIASAVTDEGPHWLLKCRFITGPAETSVSLVIYPASAIATDSTSYTFAVNYVGSFSIACLSLYEIGALVTAPGNVIAAENDLTSGSWGKFVVSADVANGLRDNAGGFVGTLYQSITVVNATAYTFSCRIGKDNLPSSHRVLRIDFDEAAGRTIDIDTKDGSVDTTPAGWTVNVVSEDDVYWRLTASFTSTTTGYQLRIQPAAPSAGTQADCTIDQIALVAD
jgi:hypothetical protein